MIEIQAMAVSCLIESPISFMLVRLRRWPCRGAVHAGAASAAATAITHPQFWAAALWSYEHFAYWPTILTLESIVVLVEGCLIAWMAGLRLDRAMIASLLANSASCLFGIWWES